MWNATAASVNYKILKLFTTFLFLLCPFLASGQQWQNITPEKGAVSVTEILQDKSGNLLLLCERGVYVSHDKGITRDKLFASSFQYYDYLVSGKRIQSTIYYAGDSWHPYFSTQPKPETVNTKYGISGIAFNSTLGKVKAFFRYTKDFGLTWDTTLVSGNSGFTKYFELNGKYYVFVADSLFVTADGKTLTKNYIKPSGSLYTANISFNSSLAKGSIYSYILTRKT